MLIKKHFKAFVKFTEQTKSQKWTHKTEQNIQENSNKIAKRRPKDKHQQNKEQWRNNYCK
jgi:hypothetical protein